MLDLTKPIDASLEIYREENYQDPAFSCVEWCSIEKQGYLVSAIGLGTQTGTHIDAPAHFSTTGKFLDALPLKHLIGSYFLQDLSENVDIDDMASICDKYNNEQILFLRSKQRSASIAAEALELLLNLPPLVWVVDGSINIPNASPLEFHQLLANHGKFLIENLNSQTAKQVKPGGLLIALPLALTGTSGAPCRVVVQER